MAQTRKAGYPPLLGEVPGELLWPVMVLICNKQAPLFNASCDPAKRLSSQPAARHLRLPCNILVRYNAVLVRLSAISQAAVFFQGGLVAVAATGREDLIHLPKTPCAIWYHRETSILRVFNMQLTSQGSQIIEEIARRYTVSMDAVMVMLQAVANGGGTMAQFSHPELGGSGQWMQGGMTMVGDMFNNNLKAKVDNLCCELAGLLANQQMFAPPPQAQNQGGYGPVSLFVDNSGGQWWPAELGNPSSNGAQNNLRYAIFPFMRRLAIDIDGQVTVYDTLDHQIGGVGQQQGSGASFTFTSQYGVVPVTSLPVVNASGNVPDSFQPAVYEAPAYEPPNSTESDIFAKIERLAELRQRGILSDEEFSGKKAELLSRL